MAAASDLAVRAELSGTEPEAVSQLEDRIARLVGKPVAAMFPTGAMAQQVALRIHAEHRGVTTVAFHPTCHLELHELHGYNLVHGLIARLTGDPGSLITISDLDAIDEPIAALLLELPQREIGGQLPGWDDLVAQTEWARRRGVAIHMDGARLWEAQPFYDRPHAEIAALFDTVYVSLYKGLMAPTGAVLAGEPEFIEQATVWRDRLGGNTERCWPEAMLALDGLDRHLPRMAEYLDRARSLAARLTELEGVHIVPDPPATPLVHLHLDAPLAAVKAVRDRFAVETGLLLPGWMWEAGSTECTGLEINVAAQFDVISDDEMVWLFDGVMTSAGRSGG